MTSICRHLCIGVTILVLSTQAQAQTVGECLSEVRKVQAFVDNEPDSQDQPADINSDFLEMAENAAAQGDAKKCMEFVEQAKGAVGYYEQ